MHFLLAYNVDNTSSKCRPIHKRVQDVLKPFIKANLFADTYIIKANRFEDWEQIRKDLTEISEVNGCDCKFVMTPLLQGGYYNGWLGTGTWPIIDEIIK